MRLTDVRGSWTAVLLAVVVAAALLASFPAAPRGALNRWKIQPLTRWHKFGYWAHAKVPIRIHARPTIASPVVARLRLETAEGLPQVYLVLSRLVKRNGQTWLRVAIPMRPNGRTGWVVHRALGGLHRVGSWLVVDRSGLRARFLKWGRTTWSAPVGIGKQSTPTPRGLFWATELLVSHQTFFGPYAFGTSAYASVSDWPGGGVVGVHGTSLPQLVPGRPSHGCIRMRNKDILWLAQHMPVGTPISVTR